MQEAILGQVVRLHIIRRQLPQEISDLGLMAANQFAERRRILCGDGERDEDVILGTKRVCGCVDQSLPAKRQMIRYARPMNRGNAAIPSKTVLASSSGTT